MPETNSEGMNVAAVAESTQGADPPPTTDWLNLECDAIGDPGPSYKKMARTPYTITRQLRRPFVSGLDCSLTLDVDPIKDHIDFFGPAIFKSAFKHNGGKSQSLYRPTAVTATGYTVPANGDYAANRLFVARGFATSANNGLKITVAASTTTEIKFAGLVVEASPPANVQLEFAGVQGAAGDIELDASGNLTSTTENFTTWGLQPGQEIKIPSQAEATAMGNVLYAFSNAAYHGTAKVVSVSANLITLTQRSWAVGSGTTETTSTIRVFFTKWIRNVARNHADEQLASHAFEITYSDLATGPADAFEYLFGYVLDQATFDIPSEGKISMQLTFVGMSTSDPITARKSGPSTALNVVTSLALSTASDFIRLSVDNVDESGLYSDFQSLKLIMKNNVVGEKAVGRLGNRFTPLGVFEAQTEAEVYFVKPEIVTAVRDNRICRLSAGARNDDYGIYIDIPSMGALEAPKKIEHNRLVSISSKSSGFMDSLAGYTASMTVFAYLPRAA